MPNFFVKDLLRAKDWFKLLNSQPSLHFNKTNQGGNLSVMKKTRKIIVFTAGIFVALTAMNGEIFARRQQEQTTPNPVIKRNSPFFPNPKKRNDGLPLSKEQKQPEQIGKTDKPIIQPEENNVKIEKAKLTVENSNTAIIPLIENSLQQPTTSETNLQPETEFESRSVAKKTLEVVKRSTSVTAKLPTEIYKIGAGDVLDIRILNSQPKGSTLFTVLESGLLDYPLAGEEPLQIAGLTAEEIEDLLKQKVKLYENPQISVTVRDYSSHSISVLGLVERPGTKALRREAIPLYVILAEAIPHSTANKISILRALDKRTETVKLEDNETLIYPGDIIRVTSGTEVKKSEGQSQFYYIGGEINSAGQKEFHDGLTLTQAILACGGLKKNSVRKVVIRRRDAEGKLFTTDFDLKLIKDGKVADPTLQVGDTVEIGNL